eukprot:1249631-Rhodomonas_salina.2
MCGTETGYGARYCDRWRLCAVLSQRLRAVLRQGRSDQCALTLPVTRGARYQEADKLLSGNLEVALPYRALLFLSQVRY